MEPGSGPESVPSSGSHDKSRVLDVRPLRCLAPMGAAPPPGFQPVPPTFVGGAPSFGPYPPAFPPYYSPFIPSESQRPLDQQHPHMPFQKPKWPLPPLFTGTKNDEAGSSSKNSENHEVGMRSQSANKEDGCINVYSSDVEATSNGEKQKSNKSLKRTRNSHQGRLSSPADGNRESVETVLMKFDALKRRLAQIEEAKEGMSRRADLKAGTLMMTEGHRTNLRKRMGTVPGVEIGDVFYFRFEMCLVGLHAPTMAGIDYMNFKFDQEEEPVAVSIVSSGGYEDDVERGDVLIYSGQGGNSYKKDGKQVADQKLERGNLALERSLQRANEVRVIRGVKDVANPMGKVYIYDGLYKIQESWTEKGKSGCNVFKYKLLRVPGQPEAFVIWKSIQQWREKITSRPGVILQDLTSGAESIPIPLVNDIDDERGPSHFTYVTNLKYSKPVNSMEPSLGCKCPSGCLPGDLDCSCIRKNGGNLPYTATRVLVIRKPLIHECGPSCLCYPNCRNQVSQNGPKVHLEVFKTKDRGWGLRSWDPIRAGTFICEYAGQIIIDKTEVEEDGDKDEEDEYIFDTNLTCDNSFEWNYIPELLEEERPADSNEAYKSPLPLIISAKNIGNVARFMNHSCSPNVFWQPVLHEHNNEAFPHIMFYAIKHIPPMTELTYDYGAHRRRKKCLCGSSKCRGSFG